MPDERLETLVNELERPIGSGAQIYWVCPLVAESEVLDMAAAEERHAALQKRFGDKVGPCSLTLACRADDDRLSITIEDDGVGGKFYSDPRFEEGIGLTNVRGRLEQMYGREHTFSLKSKPGAGTRIEVRVPLLPTALFATQ